MNYEGSIYDLPTHFTITDVQLVNTHDNFTLKTVLRLFTTTNSGDVVYELDPHEVIDAKERTRNTSLALKFKYEYESTMLIHGRKGFKNPTIVVPPPPRNYGTKSRFFGEGPGNEGWSSDYLDGGGPNGWGPNGAMYGPNGEWLGGPGGPPPGFMGGMVMGPNGQMIPAGQGPNGGPNGRGANGRGGAGGGAGGGGFKGSGFNDPVAGFSAMTLGQFGGPEKDGAIFKGVIIEARNTIIIGNRNSGKTTILNHILGYPGFPKIPESIATAVLDPMSRVTQNGGLLYKSQSHYHLTEYGQETVSGINETVGVVQPGMDFQIIFVIRMDEEINVRNDMHLLRLVLTQIGQVPFGVIFNKVSSHMYSDIQRIPGEGASLGERYLRLFAMMDEASCKAARFFYIPLAKDPSVISEALYMRNLELKGFFGRSAPIPPRPVLGLNSTPGNANQSIYEWLVTSCGINKGVVFEGSVEEYRPGESFLVELPQEPEGVVEIIKQNSAQSTSWTQYTGVVKENVKKKIREKLFRIGFKNNQTFVAAERGRGRETGEAERRLLLDDKEQSSFRCATVKINYQKLKLNKEIQARVVEALAAKDADTKRENLGKLFDQIGNHFVTCFIVGASFIRTKKQTEDFKKSLEQLKKTRETNLVTAATEEEKDKEQKEVEQDETELYSYEVKGGDVFIRNIKLWKFQFEQHKDVPSQWAIISIEEVVPIYELFEDKLKREVEMLLA
ncbi:hypothetical protein HDV05_004407 [Chytridiales sp. JEL 0842]|nr:hypothetical protein HDV05_004407 [Chytridiales sp. JEL 0842]